MSDGVFIEGMHAPLEQTIKLADLEYLGQFDPGIKSSHPKSHYVDPQSGRKYIAKGGPPFSVRADFVGNRIFSTLGQPVILTSIDIDPRSKDLVTVMPDVSDEYNPISEATGSRFRNLGLRLDNLLTDPDHQETFKDSILPALLIGDYDRVPWNLMLSKDGSEYLNADFGASLGARARGGYNGFPPFIDDEEMRLVLRDPYDRLPNANDLHASVIEVTPEGVIIKDRDRMGRMVLEMREKLTDQVIDDIIREADWPDNTTIEGKTLNTKMVNQAIDDLEASFRLEIPHSLSYIKTQRAINTYRSIRDEFNYNIAGYFSFALKSRRDDLISRFTSSEGLNLGQDSLDKNKS